MCDFQENQKKNNAEANKMSIPLLLENTKSNIQSGLIRSLTIVLGNESGDLDSVISAMMLSMLLNWKNKCQRKYTNDVLIIPIININRKDFELKTEVIKCLGRVTLNSDNLLFRDDFDIKQYLNDCAYSSVILVDHHVLAQHDSYMVNYVTEIYDHRPICKEPWPYKRVVMSLIEPVGSCCTLITRKIKDTPRSEEFFKEYPAAVTLLHNTIILDTANLCRKSNRASALDEEMIVYLESFLRLDNPFKFRKSVLNELINARRDVSNLTTIQILKRDCKFVKNIIVPSIPMSVQQYVRKPDAEAALNTYLIETKCSIIVLLGVKMEGKKMARDILIYSLESSHKEAAKLNILFTTWTDPSLDLIRRGTKLRSCFYYAQKRATVTRKIIIPIITEFLSKGSILQLPKTKKPTKNLRIIRRH